MKRSPLSATIALTLCAAASARAHLTYTGRDFGSFTPGAGPISIFNQSVSGTFGWADGTDGDFGDSHRLRAYRFNLAYDATLTITATGTDNGGLLGSGLMPAFSIYSGLAHLPPGAADHDGSGLSSLWLSSLPGGTKEGCFQALADWRMGSDDGLAFADLSTFTYRAHAADGTAANFGAVPGIAGDGLADGTVTGTFFLLAGDYSLLVGGAAYDPQPGAPFTNYGVNVTLSAIPEPSAGIGVIMASGLLLLRRRR